MAFMDVSFSFFPMDGGVRNGVSVPTVDGVAGVTRYGLDLVVLIMVACCSCCCCWNCCCRRRRDDRDANDADDDVVDSGDSVAKLAPPRVGVNGADADDGLSRKRGDAVVKDRIE